MHSDPQDAAGTSQGLPRSLVLGQIFGHAGFIWRMSVERSGHVGESNMTDNFPAPTATSEITLSPSERN